MVVETLTRTCQSGGVCAGHSNGHSGCKGGAVGSIDELPACHRPPAPSTEDDASFNLFTDESLSRSPHFLVQGSASGPLMWSDVEISLWGGVRPATGIVIDYHHPLAGQCLAGNILALPSGRGSCSSSLGVLELILGGNGPAGLILEMPDHIIALGVLIASLLFKQTIPLVVVGSHRFHKLKNGVRVTIDGDACTLKASGAITMKTPLEVVEEGHVELSAADRDMLDGKLGQGHQQALRLLLSMASMFGAPRLIDMTQSHIDAIVYTGPGCLRFARHFADLGARFRVPTTMNAMSVDYERWREQGVAPEEAIEPCKLADAYIEMGAAPQSLTCAPYLLPSKPEFGQQIGWAESNAVVFANSVLGARTQKYPDMLEALIGLTGRAPLAGCHIEENRRPTLSFRIAPSVVELGDGSLWAALGYHIGAIVGHEIPVICGLEGTSPRESELKAAAAAFATTSAAPMFHIRGITPEIAADFDDSALPRIIDVGARELLPTWRELNSADSDVVSLVAMGNPHLALDEFAELAALTAGVKRNATTRMILTCGRFILAEAEKLGYLDPLREFGAELVTDTCWCFINRPLVQDDAVTVMTNSGKYAHYGPGWTGKRMHFGSAVECVEAAKTGLRTMGVVPKWLSGAGGLLVELE